MAKYTISCMFYLDYENGKWIAEQEYPPIKVEAETPEAALRGAMEEWISFLKNTETGKRWLCLVAKGGKPDWACEERGGGE